MHKPTADFRAHSTHMHAQTLRWEADLSPAAALLSAGTLYPLCKDIDMTAPQLCVKHQQTPSTVQFTKNKYGI